MAVTRSLAPPPFIRPLASPPPLLIVVAIAIAIVLALAVTGPNHEFASYAVHHVVHCSVLYNIYSLSLPAPTLHLQLQLHLHLHLHLHSPPNGSPPPLLASSGIGFGSGFGPAWTHELFFFFFFFFFFTFTFLFTFTFTFSCHTAFFYIHSFVCVRVCAFRASCFLFFLCFSRVFRSRWTVAVGMAVGSLGEWMNGSVVCSFPVYGLRWFLLPAWYVRGYGIPNDDISRYHININFNIDHIPLATHSKRVALESQPRPQL